MVRRIVVAAILTAILAACASTSSTASPSGSAAAFDPEALGRAFVDALAQGDVAAAEAMEDDTMRAAAPAATLSGIWQQLVGQFGDYQGAGDVSTSIQGKYTNVTLGGRFSRATVPLIVTIDGQGKVAGFHLGTPVPVGSSGPASPSPSPAAYVDPSAFTEGEVTVGAAPWTLPGTLSMPNGEGPFPAVVLVAGSGPQDRNETIGPNAPLQDLAWGLASSGIAVLRYDKRTRVYATEMAADVADVTVRQETMDDAVAAIDQVRETPGVDADRVFLIGHSLGAYLAPRIAAGLPRRLAGIGMLEANSTPLPQVILAQYEYLASAQGGGDPQAIAQLPAIRAQVARAESPDLTPSTPVTELPLGVPASYWLDLRSYDPLATIRDLSIPVFIAQGGRDYQVPPSELGAWRTALAGRRDVTIREYPSLDHLLIAGGGPSTPAEYATPGHVDGQVIDDLASWVKAAVGP